MKPINFKESNKTFLRPESMTDDQCRPLRVYQDDKYIISKWKLTFFERIQILFSGIIWLCVHANYTPPISVDLKNPFIEKGKKDE